MTSRNRQSPSFSKNQQRAPLETKKKKPVIRHRKIELNAIVDAAVDNSGDEEETDADGEEEEEEEEVVKPTFKTANNSNKTRRESSLSSVPDRRQGRRAQPPPSSYDDDYLAPGESYAYLFNDPMVRRILRWMALFAVILLWLNVAVLILWLAGRIPGLPSSVLYYGFIFYTLFITVAILTLFTSCSTENAMHTVTLIFLFVSLGLAILMDYMIILSIIDCNAGVIDAACSTFFFTSILLFLLTLAISVSLLVLLFLTSIMVVRIKQAYSTVNAYY